MLIGVAWAILETVRIQVRHVCNACHAYDRRERMVQRNSVGRNGFPPEALIDTRCTHAYLPPLPQPNNIAAQKLSTYRALIVSRRMGGTDVGAGVVWLARGG